MKNSSFFLLLLFLIGAGSLQAQNPLIKMWDRTFGGLEDDEPTCYLQTSDGGYILGGYTYSGIGGDKSEALKNGSGVYDYWILKLDSLGNKQWDKDLGGLNGDQLYSILQTEDGGYLLGGNSASNASGDKTAASWGNYDYWIIKLDAQGSVQWDKDFGGTSSDQLSAMIRTSDGGYLLAGSSASGISGNKTDSNRGLLDFWIVKIDALGNNIWDKTFGGTDADKLYSVVQVDDGGFVLGGSSRSMAGFEKSSDSYGLEDYWMIKIDSAGTKLWDQDYGGFDSDILYSIVEDKQGNLVAGGRSGSDIGGNKYQPLWGGYDFWIIVTDMQGNKLQEKCLGGTANEDEFGNVSLTKDGGYVFAGTSYSQISGNKTESNLGQEQTWFLKFDSTLTKQWDKTVFTSCHDESGWVMQTRDQCYIVVNANGPSCTAGGDRSSGSWNNSRDYWIAKYCDTTLFPPRAAAAAMAALCPGSCTSFLNLSLRSSSWQWSFPGASPDTSSSFNPSNICYAMPGTYDVTLIASGETGVDTLILPSFITIYDFPAPQGITQSGDTLFANQGNYSYQWYFNGSQVSGATDYFYLAPANGNYNVVVTDSNGCEVEAAINSVLTSLSTIATIKNEVVLFPNPVKDRLSIQANAVMNEVMVYTVDGKKISSAFYTSQNSGSMDIDCSSWSPGVYFVQVVTNEKVSRIRFVKE